MAGSDTYGGAQGGSIEVERLHDLDDFLGVDCEGQHEIHIADWYAFGAQ